MAQGDLEARLHAILGSEAPAGDGFDPACDADLDRVASALLEHFRRTHDFATYSMLFELTYARLHRMASGLLAEAVAPLEPDDLVSALMTRVFLDVRRPLPVVQHFLGWAQVAMRHDLLDQWRRGRRARRYDTEFQTRLPGPADPAQASADGELDRRLASVAERFLALVAECFTDLEPAQRNVITARDVLGLPYERVALLLDLPGDQVGMIIKRARARLIERVVDEVRGDETLGEVLGAEGRRALVDELLDKHGARAMGHAVQRLLDVSLDAARARIADLVYELAKACLARLPDFPERTLIHAPPRRAAVVSSEARVLSARLQAARRPIELPAVSTDGARESVLEDTHRCLALLGTIEGESGRQQVLRAVAAIHAGEPGAGERILRALDDDAYDPHTRRRALVNLALALLRQDRYAEALDAARAASDRWPESPVPAVNMLYATARLGDRDGFQDALRRLADAQHSAWVAAWIDENLASLGERVGMTRTAMLTMLQREDLV